MYKEVELYKACIDGDFSTVKELVSNGVSFDYDPLESHNACIIWYGPVPSFSSLIYFKRGT